MPTSARRNHRVRLFRPPTPALVGQRPVMLLQDRIDHGPGCFHGVFAGEERAVAGHGVAEQSLVRGFLPKQFFAQVKLALVADEIFSGALDAGEDIYIFNAKISIDEFNEIMEMKLDDSDYETLGGFLYAQLDKIPNVGDTITFNETTFTVLTTRGRRITHIRVARAQQQSIAATPNVVKEEYPRPLLLSPPGERREVDAQKDKSSGDESSDTHPSEQPSHYEYRGA